MSVSGGGSSGGGRVSRLFALASSADSLGRVILTGTGAVLFAFAQALVRGVLTFGDLITRPIQALLTVAIDLVDAIFGGAASIINLGAIASALSIGPGGLFANPLSFVFGIGIVLGGLYLFGQFLQEPETGNALPGLPDIPVLGRDEEGEDDGL